MDLTAHDEYTARRLELGRIDVAGNMALGARGGEGCWNTCKRRGSGNVSYRRVDRLLWGNSLWLTNNQALSTLELIRNVHLVAWRMLHQLYIGNLVSDLHVSTCGGMEQTASGYAERARVLEATGGKHGEWQCGGGAS
jgi:hypothetical protein